ncbi:potassium/proton antiporter [Anaerotignum lactatifermentans]|uniref:Potassium/proton antiporter, CPA1 family n=2 Tax=Anaerotignum lactatifermentans TaxID=160404 RepID=A0A1M6R3Q7_9FIRM|nr:potassium/proton antiporter [Anaerotignum lactatifermentans]SHK27109.1 potassium/proton antiporter, CPA1 family [[Clostridium] lactatifermentans DSM 14214] [Anaerotignum lactatifermentans DSM 14214]
MNEILLLTGIVIIICILVHRLTFRLGVPSLLAFLALGMCFGVDGILHISFNNYHISEVICSVSLIFIMFYGGFGTNFEEARSVAVKSTLLSTLGVLFTAGLVGVFAHFVLHLPWAESMLIGSVISSTDAASVFSILRSKKLNLKDHTASMLEMESGSNDPMSYMLTLLWITILTGDQVSVPLLVLRQLAIGSILGLLLGKGAVFVLNRCNFYIDQGNTIFLLAVSALTYALPSALGGNGYLSVYLCGIVMGNSYLPHKRDLVLTFDVLTGIAQMVIFFLLGLLVTPSQLPAVFLPSVLIMAFLTLVARPLSVTAVLAPFRSSKEQIGLVSWSGLRGAASIVFAIQAVLSGAPMEYNLFNLVFCIVLLSISLQGTLLAPMAHKLNMIDEKADVRRTFNDYQVESDITFSKISISPHHPWVDHSLKDVPLPPELLVTLILRNGVSLVPNGSTVLQAGDLLVLAGHEFEDRENLTLYEVSIDKTHKWKDKSLRELSLPKGTLIVMIQNEKGTVIPDGNTVIHGEDTLVIARF